MILTANPWPLHNIYAPPRPSPLSVRSANACTRPFEHPVMSEQPKPENQKAFSKRPVKEVPIIRSRDAVKERRRDLFLKKVQQDRDERRWGQRGEQLLRLDFISDQKRWEAEKARQASRYEVDVEEYPGEPSSPAQEEMSWSQQEQTIPWGAHEQKLQEEAEQVAEQEYQELDALISAMEQEDQPSQDSIPQHFGSDDEDYDSLFMDFVSSSDVPQSDPRNPELSELDAMDMS